jgi:hypothetical protein
MYTYFWSHGQLDKKDKDLFYNTFIHYAIILALKLISIIDISA